MLRYLLVLSLFGVLVNSMIIVNPGPKYPPTKGEVWPSPQREEKEDFYYKFDPNKFTTNVTKKTCKTLTDAINRYMTILRSLHKKSDKFRKQNRHNRPKHDEIHYQGYVHRLELELTKPCENLPTFMMDESYELKVATVSHLIADSIWGILRGLETFSQLFYFSDDYNEVYINKTSIEDWPSYPHRGLLLDTSRHYLSVKTILTMIDAMAMNKMNVFHWHIVDDQSFPYDSKAFPNLSIRGAFHSSLIYTKQNIEDIVKYARERGVRVIPEFDVPGHTRSWGNAYPDILTECFAGYEVIGLGPMNPINNQSYTILEILFKEVKTLFPDDYFHIGGDEVDLECWASNPGILNYMLEHNIESVKKLHALFMKRAIPLLGNSTSIVWQEVFDEEVSLNNNTIVHVWKSDPATEMMKVVAKGHYAILSSPWYLDHLELRWQDMYGWEPRRLVPPKRAHLVLGGEACMWGEMADDTQVESRTWPRACAAAEVLWSRARAGASVGAGVQAGARAAAQTEAAVARRLEEHACRMRRRGVRVEPPSGPGYCLGIYD